MRQTWIPALAGTTAICLILITTPSLNSAPTDVKKDYVGIVKTLLELFDRQNVVVSPEDLNNTSLKDFKDLNTPAAFRLQIRLIHFGISLVEALNVARDPLLKDRMLEMARFHKDPKVRADVLLALGSLSDPAHEQYFKYGLADRDVAVRFAAVEALQLWNQPQSRNLLIGTRDLGWSPALKIFVAQALLSLGDESGLQTLWQGLDDPSWLIRAMSARYLGDYAKADEYKKIMNYLSQEHLNRGKDNYRLSRDNRKGDRSDFVVAELCIAALKLISKKEVRSEKLAYSPASPAWRENDEVKYSIGPGNVVELEPLIIVPPRLRIPSTIYIAPQIDNELLRLLRTYLMIPPNSNVEIDEQGLGDLLQLATPTGIALRFRYTSDISYLMIESLAGTKDLTLVAELEKLVQESKNPDSRAVALIALSYNRDPKHLNLVEGALRDKEPVVRFAGLEAAEIGRFKEVIGALSEMANGDPSPAFQVYAAYILAKLGYPAGYPHLLDQTRNPDWPTRAMSFWFIGRYGEPIDYSLTLERLGNEKNPFVQTEIALAALRLAPL